MPELSNLLRQRFASVAEPAVHPDADTLTAYMEKLLAPPERRQVLEHLAACRQCREVILLLSVQDPVILDGDPSLAPPARLGHPWKSWRPAWGLAASLAGLAILATVIIELPHRTTESRKQAFSAPANAVPPAPASIGSESAQPATNGSAGAGDGESIGPAQNSLRVSSGDTVRRRAAPKTVVTPVTGGPYVNVEMFASEANFAMPSVDLPSAPAPHLSSQVQNNFSLGGSVPLSAAEAPHEMPSGSPLGMIRPNPSATHFPGWTTVIAVGNGTKRQLSHRFMPAISPLSRFSNTMGGPGELNPAKEPGTSVEVTSAEVSSAFSSNGNARDAGSLDHSLAFTSPALSRSEEADAPGAAVAGKRVAGVQAALRVADGKLLKLGASGSWAEAYPSGDDVQFSVVTIHGLDVWAGGSGAALVHSGDGGTSWERITLGASATGTIHSIEVNGLKVVVRSSSGQSWSSADGGISWLSQD
jgi:hypothetical protein